MTNPHVETAKKLAKASENGSMMPTSHQANWIAMAQAQATLALAYEQRTANLLALWACPQVSINDPVTGNPVTWGISEDSVGKLLQEIHERLGFIE